MKNFSATLYGPNLPIAGSMVEAHFSSECLRVEGQEANVEVNVEVKQLTSSIGGFEHRDLFLHWRDQANNEWALSIAQNEIAAARVGAPPALWPEFEKWQGRKRYINGVWTVVGSLVGAILLCLVLGWWQYGRLVGWVADQISVARELQLGNSVLAQLKQEGDIIDQGEAVRAIEQIGQRLTKGSRYQYQWLIKKDKTVNAFAIPGGIIVVHSALLAKIENADELAAVLAHEVQHIEQRHTVKNMINSVAWATGLMLVLGDVNAATAIIIHQVGSMSYGRDSEDEADRLGYHTLVKAKVNPSATVTFLEKLKQQPGADIPTWISSHPATTDRIASFQKLLKEQPCHDCRPLAMDWKAIQNDPRLGKN